MKAKIWIGISIVIILLFSLFIFLYFTEEPEKDDLKIGLMAPLSGQFAFLGEDIVRAAELAAKKYERVSLFVEDDECDPKKGVAAAHKLIETDDVDVLIIACSSSAKAAHPITKEADILQIVLLETYIYEEDNLFQMLPPSWPLFYEIGEIGSTLGEIIIISTKSEVNEGVFGNPAQVQKGVIEGGGKVIKNIQVQPGTKDFRTDILKIKEANPDSVVSIMFKDDHAPFLKQYADMDMDIPLLGNVYYELDFETLYTPTTASLFEDTYSVNFVNNRPNWFIEDFQKEYNKTPGSFSEYSYDAITFLAKAYAQSKDSSLNALHSQLIGLQINGASGDIVFNELGNINGEIETKRFNGTAYSVLS